MKDVILTPLQEEPRVLEDAVYTWSVEGWRSMSKKEHGPVFEAGGYPWYAPFARVSSTRPRSHILQANFALPSRQQRGPVLYIP